MKNRASFNVIHVHLASSHSVAAALAGKLLRKKVIIKVGGGNQLGELYTSQRTFLGRLKLRALSFLNPYLVIVNSDQVQQLQGFGLDKLTYSQIPNGVDTDLYYQFSHEEKKLAKEKLGMGKYVFLFTGRFSTDKLTLEVFQNIMTSWKEIVSQSKDMQFWFVGRGPLKSGYLDIVRSHQVERSVFFREAQDDIEVFYKGADAFVLPSLTEGLSNSLLEALASGLPVLASRVSGITQIISEGKQGYLFNPHNQEEIKNAFLKFIKLENKQILREECRKTALEYSFDRISNAYIKLYEN
jgi:glycosyltransferase involved in cell wall biosynthesis